MSEVSQANILFCPQCDNMLWVKETEKEEGRVLLNYCRVCNYEEKSQRVIISTHVSKNQNQLTLSEKRTKDWAMDVSLKRTQKIPCPNKECPSHQEEERREVVLSTNPANLHVTYMCMECKTQWKDT